MDNNVEAGATNDDSLAAQPASKIRAFVEMCGRHPFATGLFALIGVAGLIFSFIQFGIDQQQNYENDRATDEIKTKVELVSQKIGEIDSQTVDDSKSVRDPISIDGSFDKRNFDNWSFDSKRIGQNLDQILKDAPESSSYLPFVYFTVSSKLNQEYTQVAPFLVADVKNVEKISPDIASLLDPGRGDAAVINYLNLALIPDKGLQYAPVVDQGKLRKDVQYFKLAPREPEEFMLSINYVPGYVYTVRFGMPYRYKGVVGTKWFTPWIRLGIPDQPHEIGFPGEEFTTGIHPDMELVDAKRANSEQAAYRAFARSQTLFSQR